MFQTMDFLLKTWKLECNFSKNSWFLVFMLFENISKRMYKREPETVVDNVTVAHEIVETIQRKRADDLLLDALVKGFHQFISQLECLEIRAI